IRRILRLRNADFGLRIEKTAGDVRAGRELKTDEKRAVPKSAIRNPQSAISLVFSVPRRVAFDFREGLRYVKRDSVLAAAFVVAAGWGLGNGAARALYSIF